VLSPREQLLFDLVAERFGPVARRPVPPAPTTADQIAERQRLLCAALDGSHLVAVESSQEAA
jgi:hypothetical protein